MFKILLIIPVLALISCEGGEPLAENTYIAESVSGQISYNTLNQVTHSTEIRHGVSCSVLHFLWQNGSRLSVYQKDKFVSGETPFGNLQNIGVALPSQKVFAELTLPNGVFYSLEGTKLNIELKNQVLSGNFLLYLLANPTQSGALKIKFKARI
jgi:hypothetical protein